jgi:transcriptional regulator with XRE-family HTH domain
MEFSKKLVYLRTQKKLTQTQLAERLGVTRQSVYKWESGQSYPEAMTLWEMHLLFDISLDILLDASVSLGEADTPKETEEVVEESVQITPKKQAEPKKKGIFTRLFGK